MGVDVVSACAASCGAFAVAGRGDAGLPGGGVLAVPHAVGLGGGQRGLEPVVVGHLERDVAFGPSATGRAGRGPEGEPAVRGQAGPAADHAVQSPHAPGESGVLGAGVYDVRVGGLHRARRRVRDPRPVGRDVSVRFGHLLHGRGEPAGLAAGAFVRGHAHPVGYGFEGEVGADRVDCLRDRLDEGPGRELAGLVVQVPAVEDAGRVGFDELADVPACLLPVASPVRVFHVAEVPFHVDEPGEPVRERDAVLDGRVHERVAAPVGVVGVLALVGLRVVFSQVGVSCWGW